jgi:TatD DNase family protein
LNFPQFDADREDYIELMRTERIGTITVGTNLVTSRSAVDLAQRYEHLFSTIGIHPHDVKDSHNDIESLYDLAKNNRVVAVGECGLDYFRFKESDHGSLEVRKAQKILFEEHIDIAHTHMLPLMIHARPSGGSMDAYEDILEILVNTKHQAPNIKVRGNVHFFAGTVDIARRFLDLGFSLSFDGPITFTSEYDEVIRYIPDDRIMSETDSPFAAPAPFRGKRCDPTMVRFVVQRIAEIRGEKQEIMAERLVKNAITVFGLSNFLEMNSS